MGIMSTFVFEIKNMLSHCIDLELKLLDNNVTTIAIFQLFLRGDRHWLLKLLRLSRSEKDNKQLATLFQ